MSVRAKFRCHSITLTQAVTPKKGVTWDQGANSYVDEEGNKLSRSEVNEYWDQPTVELMAVYDSNPENKKFFEATPSATCRMTISNPHAAEFFELGKEYYLDFSRASQD